MLASRPPGHHAASSVCGGYCFLNNVAITARYLQHLELAHTGVRVAILDIDYHHGNGSTFLQAYVYAAINALSKAQEIFYADSSVLYVSIHAENDYPCKWEIRSL